jgi:hypothetical protein
MHYTSVVFSDLLAVVGLYVCVTAYGLYSIVPVVVIL